MSAAIRFWRGSDRTKPEIAFVIDHGQYSHSFSIRFGRPAWRSFTERYSGRYGIPRGYVYVGPVAFIHRKHTRFRSEST